MKKIVSLSRILVGLLFIFSGLIKANDPLGLSYKMQEFFETWNLHGLDHFTLVFSVIMIVFEILAGVALLLGWKMNLFSWLLLLLIIFFSFLTGYAYLSGKIRECGCFGNCIPLTAGQSFSKDIFLLVLILFLFRYRKKVVPVFPDPANILILFFTVVFSFSIQWYVLHFLPVVDCLPYTKGSSIPEKMKAPPGSIPDSTVITLVYRKDGREVEFSATRFPKDFDDTYKFLRRYDKLVRKGNAEPPIKDFTLVSASGNDSTNAILDSRGYQLLLFALDLQDSNPGWKTESATLFSLVKMKNMNLVFVVASPNEAATYLEKNSLHENLAVLTCDITAIRTAARVNPTLYLLKHGTIINKWGASDFENALPEINALPVRNEDATQGGTK